MCSPSLILNNAHGIFLEVGPFFILAWHFAQSHTCLVGQCRLDYILNWLARKAKRKEDTNLRFDSARER